MRPRRRPAAGSGPDPLDSPAVEPGSRLRHGVRAALWVARLVIAVAAVSIVLAGAAFATTTLRDQFGGDHSSVATRGWAGRAVTFGLRTCAACHEASAAAKAAGRHAGVSCEACHPPVVDHPGSVAGVVYHLPLPSAELCLTCHRKVEGRPASVAQIDPKEHWSGSLCLRCHDPHTSIAVAPPEVTHPLTDLPACTTCHAPDGLKKVPAGHEPVADAICLECHGPKRAKP